MSDHQVKKKNKKKKSNVSSEKSIPKPTVLTSQTTSEVGKKSINNVVLSQNISGTTTIKEIKATKTSTTEGTVKGISKKNKSKNQECETVSETIDSEKLLNFRDNEIELVNHPEISVTVATLPIDQKVAVTSKEENPNSILNNTDVASKKKKKKKKKKNVVENAPNDTEEVSSNTPTYIKLPAEGENCVLLVSHDSFSNPANSANSTHEEKISNEKPTTVLIKNKDMPPIEQSLLQSEAPTTDSVSIIKVNNKQVTKPSIEMTIASGLKKADDFLKSESKGTNTSISNDSGSTGGEVETKTKAQLKAERRAIQEAQRAAKLNKNLDKDSVQVTPKNIQNKVESSSTEKEILPKSDVLTTEHTIKNTSKTSTDRKVSRKDQVFFHLPQYVDFLKQFNNTNLKIHPAILELGSHYSQGIICGSNARCIGFLAAFKKVIEDFTTPPDKSFSRELEVKLQSCLNFLNSCRTLSVSVFNVVKVIKQQITNISKDTTEDAAKENLLSEIDIFVEENIHLAMKAICMPATKKIVDGDTILVYSYSSLVKDVLCNAYDQKKSFHVIVVDSRPKLEGKEMLKRLVKHGLQCSYILIGAASYIMKKVSKVIIGAHALLSNGCVMSRVGSKQIALIASAFSVPVLVCCETYKFWERALTDSIVHNELGNSEDLLKLNMYNKENLQSCQDLTFLQVLNILYDVTPSDLITVVITEKGLLPCTSVPVVLRVKHAGSKNSGSGQT